MKSASTLEQEGGPRLRLWLGPWPKTFKSHEAVYAQTSAAKEALIIEAMYYNQIVKIFSFFFVFNNIIYNLIVIFSKYTTWI